jgi:Reverse transcriptase (RNA-dependent DNA polymerase)
MRIRSLILTVGGLYSLHNVDYKIISRSILVRFRKVVDSIVHPNQTCAVPCRSITNNLHLVRDIIDYCKERKLNACLLTLDQAKAFDRVDHNYPFSVLKAFGFGPDAISWVQVTTIVQESL